MVDSFRILTLNQISGTGLKRFPAGRYLVGPQTEQPDAILVRSQDMHQMEIPKSVKATGRAGVGTNNIPVANMSQRGMPVFNAPGANANAVKELAPTAPTRFGWWWRVGWRRRTVVPSGKVRIIEALLA